MVKPAIPFVMIGASLLCSTPALAQANEIQGIVLTNQDGHLMIETPHGDRTISRAPHARIKSV